MKTVFIAMTILMLLSFATNTLIGRWETKPSENGNVTGVVFKQDSSFEGYVNRKPFVSGKYVFQDSIFTFTDNGCDGEQGIYKIVFFSNGDSLRFVPINDSCAQRREGMSRLIMGRVK